MSSQANGTSGHATGTDVAPLLALKGKTFSLFVPVEASGKTRNYSFLFKIVGVDF
jgi:hypothetical protein